MLQGHRVSSSTAFEQVRMMMSTTVATKQNTEIAAPKAFRDTVTKIASSLLTDWVGPDRAGEAVGRVASALSSAAACSKKPEEFYACTPQSVAAVVAISALTGIMVSTGANALAYAIPRRARKGEPPQLTYQLSHRGLAAIAKRAGMLMMPVPISTSDIISVDDSGSVEIQHRDLDNPPVTMDELRGIAVVIRDLKTGHKLFCGWVPKKVILQRRDGSDAYKFAESDSGKWAKDSDPWHKWPIEMAMKTAMHYAVGRAWCVIDDTSATKALAMDVESERIVDGSVVSAPSQRISKLDDLTDRLIASEEPEQVPTPAIDLTAFRADLAAAKTPADVDQLLKFAIPAGLDIETEASMRDLAAERKGQLGA